MPTPATWNTGLVLDSVLTTSMFNYMKKLFEQVVTHNALYYRLYSKGRITEEDGGERIVVPLMYELNNTVKFYSAYENLDVTPQDGMAPANFEWKQLAGSVSIARKEERQNSGKNRILSLVESKMEQLKISMGEKLGRISYADGSEDGGKAFLGLQSLVSTGNPTVGGIDSSTATWWQNQKVDMGTAAFATATGAALGDTIRGQTELRKLYLKCTKGNQQPTIGFTHQDTFGQYEASLADNQRYVDTTTASHGFMNIRYKNAAILWDESYIRGNTSNTPGTVGKFYLLNEEYIKVILDSGTNFLPTPFLRPHNQDARTSQVLVMGNMVVTNRSRNGVLHNFV